MKKGKGKFIICAVTNLDPRFCHLIKAARQAAGLGQTEVATKVGCKQSAYSMFERGGITKLNDEVIAKLSELFGVEIIKAEEPDPKKKSEIEILKAESRTSQSLLLPTKGFCPNPHCPSNHPFEVDGRVLVRPDRTVADPVGGKFCAICGEVLEKRCPNCGAPVHDGAICSHCGEPYVAV